VQRVTDDQRRADLLLMVKDEVEGVRVRGGELVILQEGQIFGGRRFEDFLAVACHFDFRHVARARGKMNSLDGENRRNAGHVVLAGGGIVSLGKMLHNGSKGLAVVGHILGEIAGNLHLDGKAGQGGLQLDFQGDFSSGGQIPGRCLFTRHTGAPGFGEENGDFVVVHGLPVHQREVSRFQGGQIADDNAVHDELDPINNEISRSLSRRRCEDFEEVKALTDRNVSNGNAAGNNTFYAVDIDDGTHFLAKFGEGVDEGNPVKQAIAHITEENPREDEDGRMLEVHHGLGAATRELRGEAGNHRDFVRVETHGEAESEEEPLVIHIHEENEEEPETHFPAASIYPLSHNRKETHRNGRKGKKRGNKKPPVLLHTGGRGAADTQRTGPFNCSASFGQPEQNGMPYA
jgi:hypothetical protein